MNSGTVILDNILLFFIYNLSFIVTSTSDGNTIVTSTEIYSVKNVTVPDVNYKTDNLKNEVNVESSVLEPSVDVELNIDVVKDNQEKYQNLESNIVAEKSEVSKEMISNESPAILPLSESSTIEIENLAVISKATVSQNEANRTKDNPVEIERTEENISHYSSHSQQGEATVTTQMLPNVDKNATEEKTEDIPSFSEWAQKRLEEVEKNEQANSSLKGQTTNGKASTAKLRSKNYASLDCGAKVVAANPESTSPGAILSPSSDEYKLNPCTSRIWFVVELCESIQIKRIDLANYELFSSSPKDFTVSVSDRYPTRDWTLVGKFTAKDERDIQNFDLDTDIFGKYVKVDIKSHYGSEHYCPISLFRAYGTSVFEVLQKEDPAHVSPVDDDEDDVDDEGSNSEEDGAGDDESHIAVAAKKSENSQKNLFSSATDAVISIVKRAAEVLGNKVDNQTTREKVNGTIGSFPFIDMCSTPSYMIFCKNCADRLFEQIYELISCKATQIKKLMEVPFIYKALSNSLSCRNFDHEFKVSNASSSSITRYIRSFFPLKYIGAMCNEISILENRGVLNNSQQLTNTTANITNEKVFMLKVRKPPINNSESKETKLGNTSEIQSSERLFLNNSEEVTISKANASDITNVSQINPTKALTMDADLSETDTSFSVTKSSEITQSFEITSSAETMATFSSNSFFEGAVEPATDTDVVSEGVDVLDVHLEHFISEFNADYSQNPSISPSSTTNSPQAQKESIFLRLSNRIKALERNMSLSSQYLEELSRRYKKQVEEMQNLLEKTVISLREESLKKDVRNQQLEDRLNNLTALIESLIDERRNWFLTTFWLVCSVISVFGIYFFCGKPSTSIKSTRNDKEATEILYHKPVDTVDHNLLEKKKRRPSDQVMKILHCSTSNGEEKSKFSQRQRKRKKKNVLKRSNSIGSIKAEKSQTRDILDWVDNSHHVIEDIRFVLDESDHTTLEAYPLENEVNKVELPYVQSTYNSKYNTNSSQLHENEIIVDKSNLEISNRKGSNSSVIEPMKKERRSLKKLFKKVF